MALQIMQMSETELRTNLITADFRGMIFKKLALDRLLELAFEEGRQSAI